ncbi:diadenylate cyclase CdaA [Clostridium sp.]|uniref:diadenylate cyclase CdaA n=1 Tax=Clostridium sp. TaxID=1506 RepID=UPI003FA527C6
MLTDFRNMLSILENITIWNIVDILIVAYIFYKLFILIKETRAEQLIKGLVFIVVVMKLSEVFGLMALNYLIQSTLTVGVIALIIIFQPELRKALERLGRSKIITRKLFDTEEEIEDVTKEIAKSVQSLSQTKTGALIVIEMETGLVEYTENSTKIDGLVSSQLLENIFVENTPLHDGAVIIRRNRILAAAAVLPLTHQNVNKSLGTRHRAALGISEASDAIAIVVSEETGNISLAVNGRLTRNYNEEKLISVLTKVLKQNSTSSTTMVKRVKQWFKKIIKK